MTKAKSENKDTRNAVAPVKTNGANLFAWLDGLEAKQAILLICLLACLAYANSLGGDFVFDDTEQIVENPDVRSWGNLGRAFTTHVWEFRDRPETLRVPVPPPYYRPVFTVMLTVEYQLFGVWSQGWHMVSLLLHILCSIGVYYVLLLIANKKHVAIISAALFAVYSVHVESVSWISGMTDPLFGAFFLASLYFYLKHRAGNRPTHLAASLGLFALAAFSKETALSLALLIFVYELIEAIGGKASLSARALGAARRAAPYVGIAIFYLIPRYLVLGGLTWKNPQAHQGPFTDTLLTLPWVITSYFAHLIWPVNLSVAYETSFVTSITAARFLIPAAAILAALILLLAYRNKVSREVWHALAFIFVPLLPVLDLRQLSEEYLICDRYLYLSVAGWCLLLALGFAKLARQKSARALQWSSAAAVLLVVALTAATARENLAWADPLALWSNVARIRPNFWAAHYNTGIILLDAKNYDGALAALNRAARLAPDEARVFDALGRAYDAVGDAERAVASFKRSLEIDPQMFESLNNLGTVHFKKGDYKTAEKQFTAALQLKPQAAAARFNLAVCMARQGRYAESAKEFERILEWTPDDAEVYYELGLAYQKTGRAADSVRALQRGLALAPSRTLADKISEQLGQVTSERN